MNEEGTTEAIGTHDPADVEPIEVPWIFTASLALPVFAVLVFIFMRLFGRRSDVVVGPPEP